MPFDCREGAVLPPSLLPSATSLGWVVALALVVWSPLSQLPAAQGEAGSRVFGPAGPLHLWHVGAGGDVRSLCSPVFEQTETHRCVWDTRMSRGESPQGGGRGIPQVRPGGGQVRGGSQASAGSCSWRLLTPLSPGATAPTSQLPCWPPTPRNSINVVARWPSAPLVLLQAGFPQTQI